MPFKSKAQQKYLHARHPKVAEEFSRGMSGDSMKNLPEHVADLGRKPESLRYASDVDVKKNVEDAHMDLDKLVRSGVLSRLIEDLQELDFDKKLKPKMISISVDSGAGGDDMSQQLESLDEGEVPAEDVMTEGETMQATGMEPAEPAMEGEDYEDEDMEGMDPRLLKMIRAKRRRQ